MNEGMNEWMIEWMIEWMNDWMNEWLKEWMIEWMNDWINEWLNEWIDEWINEWMIDWMDVEDRSNLGISMSNINFATPQDAGEWWMNELIYVHKNAWLWYVIYSSSKTIPVAALSEQRGSKILGGLFINSMPYHFVTSGAIWSTLFCIL